MDYNWLMEFKKTYSASKPVEQQSYISLSLEEETPKQSYPNKDSHINVMGKTYTLEDGEGLMAELKSTHGKMAEMRGRRRSALPLCLSKNLLTIKFTSK